MNWPAVTRRWPRWWTGWPAASSWSGLNRDAAGTQCSYCDCPIGPDSPHRRRGYVCPYLCHAEAAYVAVMAGPSLGIRPIPLCERHFGDWHEDFLREMGGRASEADILGPWMDDG